MPKKLFRVIFITAWLLLFSSDTFAEMTSENYRIRSSVHSAAGVPTGSANFLLNGTAGQPSPLMDPLDPPLSDTYDLYPGFWYVIAALESTCPGDFNGDKDVDGLDLAEYLFDSGGLGLEVFAPNYGNAIYP